MSQQQPETRTRVEVDVVTALIQATNIGHEKTSLLFSVSDGEWRALYTFQEMVSPAIQQALAFATGGGPLIQYTPSNLGSGILPTSIDLMTPRTVDQLVARPGPTSARLLRLDRGSTIRLELQLFGARGFSERLPLFLKPQPGGALPAPVEFGTVNFHRVHLI